MPGHAITMAFDVFTYHFFPTPAEFEEIPEDVIQAIHEEIMSTVELAEECEDEDEDATHADDNVIARGWADILDQFKELCPGYTLDVPASRDSDEDSESTDEGIKCSLLRAAHSGLVWLHERLPIRFRSGTTPPDAAAMLTTTPAAALAVKAALRADVEQVQLYQHRTCVFALLVDEGIFHALRWDRNGVIVTNGVDYTTLAGVRALSAFLYTFARMSEAQQGLDPTATLLEEGSCGYRQMDLMAESHEGDVNSHEHDIEDITDIPPATRPCDALSPSQVSLAGVFMCGEDESYLHHDPARPCRPHRDHPAAQPNFFAYTCALHVPAFAHAREAFAASLVPRWPRYALTVGGRTFLVGKPLNVDANHPLNIFGRGTRGYVALDWAAQRFVFIKDAWRLAYDGLELEGAVLAKLNAQRVAHVPTLVAHGDIPGQETQTNLYVPPSLGVTAADPQVHYRIAVAEVCLPMDRFVCARQLVRMVGDCMKAHEQAYEKCRYFHGDISEGNLMICPTVVEKNDEARVVWKGMLTDWEFGCPVLDDDRAVAARNFTGTWPFVSCNRQNSLVKCIQAADEVESIGLVLLYHLLWYIPSTHRDQVEHVSRLFFDGRRVWKGRTLCGFTRKESFERGEFLCQGKRVLFCRDGDEDHPLNGLVRDLMTAFQVRYTRIHVLNPVRECDHPEEMTVLDEDEPPECKHRMIRELLKSAIKNDSEWPENDRYNGQRCDGEPDVDEDEGHSAGLHQKAEEEGSEGEGGVVDDEAVSEVSEEQSQDDGESADDDESISEYEEDGYEAEEEEDDFEDHSKLTGWPKRARVEDGEEEGVPDAKRRRV